MSFVVDTVKEIVWNSVNTAANCESVPHSGVPSIKDTDYYA